MQTYVLQKEREAVMIDTTVAALRDRLFAGLSGLLGDSAPIDVVMTRYNFDTLVNFPWLRRNFPVDRLYTSLLAGFVLGTDSVMSFMDAFEEAHTEAQVRHAVGIEPMGLPQNSDFTAGGRRMRCVAAPFRLLLTNWVYDYDTQSLFSSDAWGIGTLAGQDDRPVIDDSEDARLTRDAVANALSNRFDWLLGADTDPIRRSLDALFEEYPVQRICPSHGAVIEGVGAVQLIRELTDDVLEEFHTTRLPSLVVGTPQYPTRVFSPADFKEQVA